MKLETSEFMVQHLTELIESHPPIDKALYFSIVKEKHEKNIIRKKMLKPYMRCEFCGQRMDINRICLICRI